MALIGAKWTGLFLLVLTLLLIDTIINYQYYHPHDNGTKWYPSFTLSTVSCTELIKQSLVDDSNVGKVVKPYVDRGMLGKLYSYKWQYIEKVLCYAYITSREMFGRH